MLPPKRLWSPAPIVPTMEREQEIALRLRLAELPFELRERALQTLHLRLLVADLLVEVLRELLVRERTVQSRAGQRVVLLLDGELRLAHPILLLVLVLQGFLREQVLIRDRDRNLRLQLQELVLHV